MYTELAERVVLYKKGKDGGRNMSSAWDELIKEEREEARTESRTETARRMLADGMNDEKVAEYSGLSLTEVQKLAAGK